MSLLLRWLRGWLLGGLARLLLWRRLWGFGCPVRRLLCGGALSVAGRAVLSWVVPLLLAVFCCGARLRLCRPCCVVLGCSVAACRGWVLWRVSGCLRYCFRVGPVVGPLGVLGVSPLGRLVVVAVAGASALGSPPLLHQLLCHLVAAAVVGLLLSVLRLGFLLLVLLAGPPRTLPSAGLLPPKGAVLVPRPLRVSPRAYVSSTETGPAPQRIYGPRHHCVYGHLLQLVLLHVCRHVGRVALKLTARSVQQVPVVRVEHSEVALLRGIVPLQPVVACAEGCRVCLAFTGVLSSHAKRVHFALSPHRKKRPPNSLVAWCGQRRSRAHRRPTPHAPNASGRGLGGRYPPMEVR